MLDWSRPPLLTDFSGVPLPHLQHVHCLRRYPFPVPVSPPAFSWRTRAPLRTSTGPQYTLGSFKSLSLSVQFALPRKLFSALWLVKFHPSFQVQVFLECGPGFDQNPIPRVEFVTHCLFLRLLCTSHHNTSQCAAFTCRGTFGLRTWVSQTDLSLKPSSVTYYVALEVILSLSFLILEKGDLAPNSSGCCNDRINETTCSMCFAQLSRYTNSNYHWLVNVSNAKTQAYILSTFLPQWRTLWMLLQMHKWNSIIDEFLFTGISYRLIHFRNFIEVSKIVTILRHTPNRIHLSLC